MNNHVKFLGNKRSIFHPFLFHFISFLSFSSPFFALFSLLFFSFLFSPSFLKNSSLSNTHPTKPHLPHLFPLSLSLSLSLKPISSSPLYPISYHAIFDITKILGVFNKLTKMAPSLDFAASILLCAEDNNSILSFDDEGEEEVTYLGEVDGNGTKNRAFCGDFLMDFPRQSEECLALLVERETEHLPLEGYSERLLDGSLEISSRRDAIDWIWKVHAHYNFGPLSAYLSVNYLDRFLSAYELPQGKAWMTQLLSVACLSLAAKMEENQVPLSLDLQVCDSKFVFEAKTIQRMELLVLSTLKWRMQAVTPFTFLDYFLHKFNNGKTPDKFVLSQSAELILNIIKGTDFLTVRPSEIAASVALTVLGEVHIVDIENTLSTCAHVSKERVLRCYEVIQSKFLTRNPSLKKNNDNNNNSSSILISSVPQSPIGVLDAACLSYKSGESRDTPSSKRRKIWR
ncbi:hypothetical protein LUZ60_002670 [Juncus effusus]|nr:hypothetical protein LUZ60_002670 [Juncus effusus]